MPKIIEVLFTPAEFAALSGRDLSQTVCVVFDVLRATSTIVTALANGAASIIPVAEISDALTLRRANPTILLAGEREGLRIRKELTSGIDFDFGNSPREFVPGLVDGKTIGLTTTNGSRALRACTHAAEVLAGSFLNLAATAAHLQQKPAAQLLLVCSGTGDQTAYEDLLGCGALVARLAANASPESLTDSAKVALEVYRQHSRDLLGAARNSRNGRRLDGIPELRDDLEWCFQQDKFPLVAKLTGNSIIKLP